MTNRDKIEDAYAAAHIRALTLLENLHQRIEDLPARRVNIASRRVQRQQNVRNRLTSVVPIEIDLSQHTGSGHMSPIRRKIDLIAN
jgi:hypothetical protein